MPYFWSLSEQWELLMARIQRAWSRGSSRVTAQSILFGFTLAILLLSMALGSFLLFVLGIAQGFVIFQLLCNERNPLPDEGLFSAAEIVAGLHRRLPTAETVRRAVYQAGTVFYRLVYRLTMCLFLSLLAGLAALSTFVLKQAELWQWTALQASGPPLGAMLVTGLVMLVVLLISGWAASRWPLLPR